MRRGRLAPKNPRGSRNVLEKMRNFEKNTKFFIKIEKSTVGSQKQIGHPVSDKMGKTKLIYRRESHERQCRVSHRDCN
ncbi:MAG: hypothetical protein LBT00_13985, partial [Spirochaetaceae bacterium]|nr:hypothetical protein [Spirochaetaceae bacterium]